jgi:hypothetical protein
VARIARLSLICAAVTIVAAGVLTRVESLCHSTAWLKTLLADNVILKATWIPNTIWDDLLDVCGQVMQFLIRMVPGVG